MRVGQRVARDRLQRGTHNRETCSYCRRKDGARKPNLEQDNLLSVPCVWQGRASLQDHVKQDGSDSFRWNRHGAQCNRSDDREQACEGNERQEDPPRPAEFQGCGCASR